MQKIEEGGGKEKRSIKPCYDTARKHSSKSGEADPRIVALVRFIARRAAEEDYKELLRAIENGENKEE